MSLWLRARHVRGTLLTLAAITVALAPASRLLLPIPNLLGGPALAQPLVVMLSLAVAIALARGLTGGDRQLELVASRPIAALDVAYSLTIGALALGAATLVWLLGGPDLVLMAGRNIPGYIGLLLIGRRLLGLQAAPVLPTGFVIAAALFGSAAGDVRWWAWPLAHPLSLWSWLSAAGLLLLGVLSDLAGDRLPGRR